MKRFLILMLALVLCIAFVACEEENVPSESNKPSYSVGLRYELKDDDTYKVVGIGDCTDKNVIIPNEHDGKPVTSIGDFAFSNRVTFTSVTIPDSVTSIGESAFYGCTSLESVTIPNSVISIAVLAFKNCTSLTSILVDENNTAFKSIDGNLYSKDGKTFVQYAIGKTATSFEIPSGVTEIGHGAFSYCTSLTSVTIPDSVTWIGSYAFEGCTALASVTIPNSVASIGNDAFSGCKSLTSVEIPTSVTSIGSRAFWLCGLLTSVTIPNSVTFIGNDAFSSCTSLTSILVDENNTAFKSIDGNLYSKDGKTFIQYAVGKTATSFEIPSGVTSIAWGAFRGCTALASVTIPNSVKTIGDYAFAWCTALTIYCEAESQPSTWDSDWNVSDRPVVWGHTHSYADGKCVCGKAE